MNLIFEPDLPPRNSEFHKRIVATKFLENTRTGKYLELECGHVVMSFGDLANTEGRVLCLECKGLNGHA